LPDRQIDPEDREVLAWAAEDRMRFVEVVVSGAAYSCCGRGWQRRDGYEQTYRGWVDNYMPPKDQGEGTFMLYSPGLGTVSYVVAVRFAEVLDVQRIDLP